MHRGSLFLSGFDRDVRRHLDRELRRRGIDLRFRCQVRRIERLASGALRVELEDGAPCEVDAVVAAIGRAPRTQDLGLERAGVATDARGAILVDRTLRSSAPSLLPHTPTSRAARCSSASRVATSTQSPACSTTSAASTARQTFSGSAFARFGRCVSASSSSRSLET